MGDVHGSWSGHRVGVLIRIWPDTVKPLSGRVAVEGAEPRRFEGWLQLLGILAELLEPARASGAPAGGRGGELDP
jgi:hypothetical protein